MGTLGCIFGTISILMCFNGLTFLLAIVPSLIGLVFSLIGRIYDSYGSREGVIINGSVLGITLFVYIFIINPILTTPFM